MSIRHEIERAIGMKQKITIILKDFEQITGLPEELEDDLLKIRYFDRAEYIPFKEIKSCKLQLK